MSNNMKQLEYEFLNDCTFVIRELEELESIITLKVLGQDNDYTLVSTNEGIKIPVGEWTVTIDKHPVVYSSFYRNAYLIFDACYNQETTSLQLLILLGWKDNEGNENDKVIKLTSEEIVKFFVESLNKLAEQTSVPDMDIVVNDICWLKKYPV